MRARAQVYKVALAVERQLLLIRQVVDQLHLVGLAPLLHQGDGFLARQHKALLALIALDDARHLLLNLLQVLRLEGLFHIKIVVKSVLNGGANGQLGLGEEVFDRACHHVAGGMPQQVAGFLILKAQGNQLPVLVDGHHQLDKFAVDARGDGVLPRFLIHVPEDVQGVYARLKLFCLSLYCYLHTNLLIIAFNKRKTPIHTGTDDVLRGSTQIAGLAGLSLMLYRASRVPVRRWYCLDACPAALPALALPLLWWSSGSVSALIHECAQYIPAFSACQQLEPAPRA